MDRSPTTASGLNPLPFTDPAIANRVDDAVRNDTQCDMRVCGRVVGANSRDRSASTHVVKVRAARHRAGAGGRRLRRLERKVETRIWD